MAFNFQLYNLIEIFLIQHFNPIVFDFALASSASFLSRLLNFTRCKRIAIGEGSEFGKGRGLRHASVNFAV